MSAGTHADTPPKPKFAAENLREGEPSHLRTVERTVSPSHRRTFAPFLQPPLRLPHRLPDHEDEHGGKRADQEDEPPAVAAHHQIDERRREVPHARGRL